MFHASVAKESCRLPVTMMPCTHRCMELYPSHSCRSMHLCKLEAGYMPRLLGKAETHACTFWPNG